MKFNQKAKEYLGCVHSMDVLKVAEQIKAIVENTTGNEEPEDLPDFNKERLTKLENELREYYKNLDLL